MPGPVSGGGPRNDVRPTDQGGSDRSTVVNPRVANEANRPAVGVNQVAGSPTGPSRLSFLRPSGSAASRSFLSRSPLGSRY
jgi:hypothetical protein